jgi:4,5-DOPA dioxygenase extradiol
MTSRRAFLTAFAAGMAALMTSRIPAAAEPPKKRMPVLFVGHGSPMNVVEDNRWSRGFSALAGLVPKPQAILCVSAHWSADGLYLTGDAHPRLIHDMSGFPPAVQEYVYPAKGQPDLAARARRLIGEARAKLDESWGIDHGTWSVLARMYPLADVPVVQLSLDERLTAEQHLAIAKSLAPLRDEGVLILGSGNITHNLGDAFKRMRSGDAATPPWAERFDRGVAESFVGHDEKRLLSLWPGGEDAKQAHPWADHYLPVLYAFGAVERDEPVAFPIDGFDAGSLSMRTVLIG